MQTTMESLARDRRRARARGREDRLAGGPAGRVRRAPAAPLEAAARSASSSAIATRRSRDDDRRCSRRSRSQAAVALEHGRAALRGVLAQEIHHRVKNNLQTVASLLRLQARAESVDPRKALGDSVNRILAIAAVHEVLTEHREDDVDLGELVDRLRAMLVQGLVAGQGRRPPTSSRSRSRGERATALALVFSELLGNALEHGGEHVAIALARDGDDVVLDGRRRRCGYGRPGRHRPLDRARARPRRARRRSARDAARARRSRLSRRRRSPRLQSARGDAPRASVDVNAPLRAAATWRSCPNGGVTMRS